VQPPVCRGAAALSWENFLGSIEHAELFDELHREDPHAAAQLAQAVTRMPQVGSDFQGFHLQAELGRGAFCRAYLAQQGDLANRLVVLKIGPHLTGESYTLAQLQHTHIVPIYSFHRLGPFHAVCMPYFGATTLADVLADLHAAETLPTSGRELVAILEARRNAREAQLCQVTRPSSWRRDTLQMLEQLTYVEAILWLTERLAEGLAHAHERGILHRDLKPANILLTDDGQPVLSDFNLSEDTKLRTSARAARIGGTLGYMAPEHLDTFQGGKQPVDGRSDLYALGMILFELLTRRNAFRDSTRSVAGCAGCDDRCAPPTASRGSALESASFAGRRIDCSPLPPARAKPALPECPAASAGSPTPAQSPAAEVCS
jgi:serine/threonine protein kinase